MIISRQNLLILNRGFRAAFRSGFGQADAIAERMLYMTVPSDTLIEHYGWLGQFPSVSKWVGERKFSGIDQHAYTLVNEKYDGGVEVLRDAIRDDRHAVYQPLMMEMGRAAAVAPVELVTSLLKTGHQKPCYDGQYFFDADHPVGGKQVSNWGGGAGAGWYLLDLSRAIKPLIYQQREPFELEVMDDPNDEAVFTRQVYRYSILGRGVAGFGLWQLAYGSRQDLNAAGYKSAYAAIEGVTSDEGRPLGCRPTHLVVPPSLRGAALELLNAERNAAGATNVWRGTSQLVVSPWLA